MDQLFDEDPFVRQVAQSAFPGVSASIVGHSYRVLGFALAEATKQDRHVLRDDLIIACLFHDSGTAADNTGRRFEVVGADRARDFAQHTGLPDISCEAIWQAIALHTSPGLAEHAGPLVRVVRAAVVADFADPDGASAHDELGKTLNARYPRDDIEHHLGRAVVHQALGCPEKAPAASWPGDLLRGYHESPDAFVNPYF